MHRQLGSWCSPTAGGAVYTYVTTHELDLPCLMWLVRTRDQEAVNGACGPLVAWARSNDSLDHRRADRTLGKDPRAEPDDFDWV